jgi:hypothetical protein
MLQNDHAIEGDALAPARPSILITTTHAPTQHTTHAVEEAAQLPPPYSMTGRPPHYAQLDSHRGPNIANSSSAGDVFAPAEFDRIFLRLQQELARLRTETEKLQAMKNQAAEQDARNRDVLSRIRDEVILKAKRLHCTAGLSSTQRASAALCVRRYTSYPSRPVLSGSSPSPSAPVLSCVTNSVHATALCGAVEADRGQDLSVVQHYASPRRKPATLLGDTAPRQVRRGAVQVTHDVLGHPAGF